MPEYDDLVADLHELGRSVRTPPVTGMDEAVLARVAQPAATTPKPRRLLRAVAVAVAALLALLLVPPVRAAISDWFGFGSVVVREDDGSSDLPTVSPTPPGPSTSLQEAAAEVSFPVVEVPALGPPRGVFVSPDRRIVTLLWAEATRLDQSSSLSYTFAKSAESYDVVSVDGRDALWFEDSHQVAVLDEQGSEVVESRRRAGSTLVWMVDDTTLRLEGELTRERAVDIAETARRFE